MKTKQSQNPFKPDQVVTATKTFAYAGGVIHRGDRYRGSDQAVEENWSIFLAGELLPHELPRGRSRQCSTTSRMSRFFRAFHRTGKSNPRSMPISTEGSHPVPPEQEAVGRAGSEVQSRSGGSTTRSTPACATIPSGFLGWRELFDPKTSTGSSERNRLTRRRGEPARLSSLPLRSPRRRRVGVRRSGEPEPSPLGVSGEEVGTTTPTRSPSPAPLPRRAIGRNYRGDEGPLIG